MKKIYLSLLASAFTFQFANAQLTLTKVTNEPVIGNVFNRKGFDSVGVIPKNAGAAQVWNFSSLVSNTAVATSIYTTVASIPSGTAYPSATIVESNGAGSYNFFKSAGTIFEQVGYEDPSPNTISFTNTAIGANWPIGFGYSLNDPLAGPASNAGTPGTCNGYILTQASGSGTLILPMGTYTNVLQVKTTQELDLAFLGGALTVTIIAIDYNYYHSSQKFPLLNVAYQTTSGFTSGFSAAIKINNNIILGTNEINSISNYIIYPNPATEKLNIVLSNDKAETVSVQIVNQLGQITKSEDLGNQNIINHSLSLSGMAKGIYFVKTTVGNKSSVKKLIVE